MFENTTKFFDEVSKCYATKIDIINYVKKITDNHQIDNLKTLKNDLDIFIQMYIGELEDEITDEMIDDRIKYYESKNIEIPYTKYPFEINPITGETIMSENKVIDLEKMFYQHQMFCIRSLEKHIESLINTDEQIKKNQTPKHDNIFSNNGFILFEYLLNNYIKPKGKRGRLSDIGFYYWKMHDSEPQYIHQRPETFKKWFYINFNNEDIGKIKPLYELKNPDREKHYSTALEWFKSQNK
jgi:hypothetical protein